MSGIEFPRRLFIAGTDTGVGKTMVSAILLAGLGGMYWKPIQTGTEQGTDAEWIRRATGLGADHFLPETYRLRRPLSPHAAAALEGARITLDAFHAPATEGTLIAEGAGGIMVPLNEREFMLDLMKRLGFPILLVARRALGTINHTLLSIEQIRRHGLEVFGVVMNSPAGDAPPALPPSPQDERFPLSNQQAIAFYGKVRVLAEIESLPEITPRALRDAFEHHFEKGSHHG